MQHFLSSYDETRWQDSRQAWQSGLYLSDGTRHNEYVPDTNDTMSKKTSDTHSPFATANDYFRRHLGIGWWSLLLFLSLGLVLEILHGFKVGWYLNVGNEIRRLMFTLAHAHGTLFSLVHIAFAFTCRTAEGAAPRWQQLASPLLSTATILLPGGFFLGGIWIYDGDPGIGIFLAPIGAIAFFAAVYLTAQGVSGKKQS